MSFQVTNAHRATYSNNMQLALQQKTSKLAPFCLPQSPSGKMFELLNLIGPVLPNRPSQRHGDTQYNNTPHSRRWMSKPLPYTYADLVDTADRLQVGIDLQGAYTQAGAATMQRARDMAFLEGYYGINLTGESGTVQTPFAAANIVPVNVGAGGATGLNIAKLREARRIYAANLVDLDMEELYIAVTAEQVDDLQSQVEVTSRDFNPQEAPVIQSGKLVKLMGFNLLNMEIGNAASVGPEIADLTLNGSNRRVPTWCRSGMAYGEWGTMTRIDPLPQKNYSTQVYAELTAAASRTEEGKCVQILCSEA
jgi:hypothetical protein